MEIVNLQEKFSKISDYWNPRIAGSLNGQHVKLVKLKGEFVWHKHDHEDELFLIINGVLDILFRDKTITLKQGEFLIIPKGVEHCPVAKEEVAVLLFEPMSTINTGDTDSELTRKELKDI